MDERIAHYQQLLEDSIQKKLPILKRMGERTLEWFWHKRLERVYGENAGRDYYPHAIRFLFGVPGGGVEWLAELLVHSDYRVKLLDNPLNKFEPAPRLATTLDMPTYQKSLPEDHPLLLIPGILSKQCAKDPNYKVCLIKQGRMLLHTEPLLRQQQIKSVFVLDDPVRILDRLLMFGDMKSEYLRHESDVVFDKVFINRFMPGNKKRLAMIHNIIKRIPDHTEKNLLRQVVTIALIQHMFKAFAAHYPEYATVVYTEELRYHPSIYVKLVQWLYGDETSELAITRLQNLTFSPMHGKQRLWKSVPSSNSSGLPEHLSEVHTSACYTILEDAGLAQDEGVFVPNRDILKSSLYYKQRKKRKTSKAA